MNHEIILTIFIAIIAYILFYTVMKGVRRAFLIPQGYVGLLYNKGKFVETLGVGRHIRWGRYYTVAAQDLRKAALLVAGQEVLTADNVAIKFSLLVTYQVTDPVKAAHNTQNWQGDLYNVAQIALRTVISSVSVDTLFGQRHGISADLLARVQPEAIKIGLDVTSVEVKDVMFQPDLKRAFAEVLKAKQEGQAALERARGESAALRNLANAARTLEDNPALMNLRLMQSLTTAQNAGNTLVLGMPGGFMPLQQTKRAPNTETDKKK